MLFGKEAKIGNPEILQKAEEVYNKICFQMAFIFLLCLIRKRINQYLLHLIYHLNIVCINALLCFIHTIRINALQKSMNHIVLEMKMVLLRQRYIKD